MAFNVTAAMFGLSVIGPHMPPVFLGRLRYWFEGLSCLMYTQYGSVLNALCDSAKLSKIFSLPFFKYTPHLSQAWLWIFVVYNVYRLRIHTVEFDTRIFSINGWSSQVHETLPDMKSSLWILLMKKDAWIEMYLCKKGCDFIISILYRIHVHICHLVWEKHLMALVLYQA